MKKLIQTSVILFLFSTSILFFQISCNKEATAQTGGVNSPIGTIVYYKTAGSQIEIWTAKYDGTTQSRVNIVTPQNTIYSDDVPPQLSPDGRKIFFTLQSSISGQYGTDLYSANFDGSGVVKIIDKGGSGNYIVLGGVY